MSVDRNDPDYVQAVIDYAVHFVRIDPADDRLYLRFDISYVERNGLDFDLVVHPAMQRWDYDDNVKAAHSTDLSTPLTFTANGTTFNGATRMSAFYDLILGPDFLGLELFSYTPEGDSRHILWGATSINPGGGGGGDGDSTSTSTDTSTSTSTSTPPTTTDIFAVKTELITVTTSKVTDATSLKVTWS